MATATAEASKTEGQPKRSPKSTKKSASNGGTKRTMSAQHKSALAKGREQRRVVQDYLSALDTHRPKRGRKVTPDQLRSRIEKAKAELPTTVKAVDRLKLHQEILDLQERIAAAETTDNFQELEDAFVKIAADFSESQNISVTAFKAMGVPNEVLAKAGLTR